MFIKGWPLSESGMWKRNVKDSIFILPHYFYENKVFLGSNINGHYSLFKITVNTVYFPVSKTTAAKAKKIQYWKSHNLAISLLNLIDNT